MTVTSMTVFMETMFKCSSRALLGVCVALGLTACGGGGGGGSSSGGNGGGGGASTFTVSGSITGLSGSGLVLSTNNQTLSVGANGTFAFPTALASGTAYNVTIATQPEGPAQNCTVANGSGTLGAANVSNIAITCANVPALTLASSTPAAGASNAARDGAIVLDFSAPLNAATVSTTSVTLRDALESQVVTVAVSGAQLTVTPQRPLLPAAAYTLTIENSVRGNGREELGAALTLSFTSRGSWQLAAAIDDGSAGPYSPAVAANGNTLVASWAHDTGLSMKRYLGGSGWNAAQSSSVGRFISSPQLAIDPQGTSHSVWVEPDSTRTSLKGIRYTSAGVFSAEEAVETDNSGSVADPRIATDASGNVFAVWRYRVGIGPMSVWANRYVAGGGWETARRIDTALTTEDAKDPEIAVDAAGNALALWIQEVAAGDETWSSTYTVGTGWGTPVKVESTPDSIDLIALGMNARGEAVAVAQIRSSTEVIVTVRRSVPGGWSEPVRLDTAQIANVDDVGVAVDAAGNALVVWNEEIIGGYETWSSRYTASGGWSPAVRIAAAAGSYYLDLAMDKAGNALAVWTTYDAANVSHIAASRYIVGQGWSGAAVIDLGGADTTVQEPRVAIDGDGNAVAVWAQYDVNLGATTIQAARFE